METIALHEPSASHIHDIAKSLLRGRQPTAGSASDRIGPLTTVVTPVKLAAHHLETKLPSRLSHLDASPLLHALVLLTARLPLVAAEYDRGLASHEIAAPTSRRVFRHREERCPSLDAWVVWSWNGAERMRGGVHAGEVRRNVSVEWGSHEACMTSCGYLVVREGIIGCGRPRASMLEGDSESLERGLGDAWCCARG